MSEAHGEPASLSVESVPIAPSRLVPAEAARAADLLPAEQEVLASRTDPPIPASLPVEPPSLPNEGSLTEPAQSWQQELAERVESFRRRRARQHEQSDDSSTLEFDFGRIAPFEEPSTDSSKVVEFPEVEVNLDAEVADPSAMPSSFPVLDALDLEEGGRGLTLLDSATAEAGDVALERQPEKREPVEIVVVASDPSPTSAPIAGSPFALPLAPLGRRFLAELADALVLCLGAGLFALIFWFAGGNFTPRPLNIVVLASIATMFLFAYFGLFTALTSATPGLLWMGLEVRNKEGLPPTTRESFWRAFGYLVSIAALMLGFVWALVDDETLTWHDRMSETFITPTAQETARKSVSHEA